MGGWGLACGGPGLSVLVGKGGTRSSLPFESPWWARDTWLWGEAKAPRSHRAGLTAGGQARIPRQWCSHPGVFWGESPEFRPSASPGLKAPHPMPSTSFSNASSLNRVVGCIELPPVFLRTVLCLVAVSAFSPMSVRGLHMLT